MNMYPTSEDSSCVKVDIICAMDEFGSNNTDSCLTYKIYIAFLWLNLINSLKTCLCNDIYVFSVYLEPTM